MKVSKAWDKLLKKEVSRLKKRKCTHNFVDTTHVETGERARHCNKCGKKE